VWIILVGVEYSGRCWIFWSAKVHHICSSIFMIHSEKAMKCSKKNVKYWESDNSCLFRNAAESIVFLHIYHVNLRRISESELAQFLSFFFNNPEWQSEQVLGSNAISKLAVLVCQIIMLLGFEKHDKRCFFSFMEVYCCPTDVVRPVCFLRCLLYEWSYEWRL